MMAEKRVKIRSTIIKSMLGIKLDLIKSLRKDLDQNRVDGPKLDFSQDLMDQKCT
jgi:hypothetical protein